MPKTRSIESRRRARCLSEPLEPRFLLSYGHRLHRGHLTTAAIQQAVVAPPVLDVATGTTGNDTITLTKDGDGQHIDWSVNGGSTNSVLITDPNGLSINGNGGADIITLNNSNGNPLPNMLKLYGTFTINGLSASTLLAGTTLNINHSTVFISYSGNDPIASIKSYLRNGYNNGAWNGTPTPSTGVITSTAAANNSAQTTAVGYADSADGLIAGQPANTIELKYTLYGDTRLTGSVAFNDFTRLTQHYNLTSGGAWDTGDFNFDGSVNFSDFTLMTRTYGTSVHQPPNDNIADAFPTAGTNVAATGSNVGATKAPGEPNHANNPGGASVWWSWFATSSGRVIVSTAGSSFDTLLGVYTQTGGLVAENDDSPLGSTTASLVRFNAIAGKTYYIGIDGYGGATGNINLNITLGAGLKAAIAGRVASNGDWWVGMSNGTSFSDTLWDVWSPSVTWVDVQTGDFNGDGRTDIIGRVQSTGQWWVDLSTGTGFTTSLWATWSPSVTWVDVHVADFNGDGRDDIVGRNSATGQWWVGLSTGSSFSTTLWTTWSSAINWVDVHVGDFSGDGRADLIGRNSATGDWWVGLSTGSAFANALWTTWSPSITWVDVQVGDFNGDGRVDIVGRDSASGNVWVGLSTGSSFNTTLWTTWSPSVTWVNVLVGDFNGDGQSDIIGRDSATGKWWVSLSNGSSFSTTLWDTWSSSVSWVDVHVGDANGDGKADIVGRNSANGQWWVGLSSGSGFNTTLWDTWSTAVSWVDVQLADFPG